MSNQPMIKELLSEIAQENDEIRLYQQQIENHKQFIKTAESLYKDELKPHPIVVSYYELLENMKKVLGNIFMAHPTYKAKFGKTRFNSNQYLGKFRKSNRTRMNEKSNSKRAREKAKSRSNRMKSPKRMKSSKQMKSRAKAW